MLSTWTGSRGEPIWIQPSWDPGQARGVFSFRVGGVSAGQFHSLNVGLHVGDNPAAVRENRSRVVQVLGGRLEDWVIPEQVHGSEVAVVGQRHRGAGASTESAIAGADGVVTNELNVTLAVLSADCVPVLFFDPTRRVIAAAHSGWRGTVRHIARRVVEVMVGQFASNPADLDVWLGPSIRQCCYEVDAQVADTVRQEFGDGVLFARRHRLDKYLLSLQQCIRSDLAAVGVVEENVHDTGVCTADHTAHSYSHRAEQGKTGRFLGAVRLVGGAADGNG